MKEIHAPYNFVPVADRVARGWAEAGEPALPEQDAPYRDGLCGEIPLTLIAETPLLVSGGKQEEKDGVSVKRFARGKNNRPEIPGSSLKGMIRAVVEIASFSAMTLIEDRRFGLRDLAGPSADSYRRKFQHHGDGEGKSLGGWLRRAAPGETPDDDASGWVIEHCRVDRYAHDRFSGDFARRFRDLQRENKLENKQAPQVYAAFAHAHGSDWRKALAVGDGELVFTGNPSKKKRKEFVFIPTGERPVPVPDRVWRGFLDVHQRQEKPSATWMWWKKRLRLAPWDDEADAGLPREPVDRIPVFYLQDGPEVIALGLAQMFKMSGSVSTREALPKAHREETDAPDLAERLFGRIDDDGGQSFRGRVSFGAAWLENAEYEELDLGETVAAAPKPGFHPAYLRQHETAPGARRRYVTWADEGASLRGWKRYPAQERETYAPPPPAKSVGKRSRSKLRPIEARPDDGPLRFSTVLRFHNLRPFELGALLWALDFGGDAEARHALGMGKPYGWGRVRLETGEAQVVANDPGAEAATLDACRAAFAQAMADRISGWEQSPQIRALRAMARPSADPSLRSMILDPERRINDFQDARNAGAVLAPPAGITDWLPAAPRGPRASRTHATPPPRATLFREGDLVRDVEQGDFGVVVEDQAREGADVLVDFDGAIEEMSPKLIERR